MKDKELTEMKNDYENIPIPVELRERVISSIDAAKQDLDREASGKHRAFRFRKLAARTAGATAAALIAISIMANSGEDIAYAMEGIPFLNAIARVVTFREYTHKENQMEASIKVPNIRVEDRHGNPIEEASDNLNRQIEEYTSQIIQAYEQDVLVGDENSRESLNLDYSIVTNNDRLFSLRFDTSVVMAGTGHWVKIYNLDKATGELLTLKDLFTEDSDYITVLSDSIKRQMASQMAEDEDVSYFYGSNSGNLSFEEIAPEENFYISESGKLTLVFDKYQVAPGYMGSVEFTIPTEDIAGIVKDGFVK